MQESQIRTLIQNQAEIRCIWAYNPCSKSFQPGKMEKQMEEKMAELKFPILYGTIFLIVSNHDPLNIMISQFRFLNCCLGIWVSQPY